MNTYKRHRFPHDIISYAAWLHYRFNLSHRDIEDLLAERRITVSRESIRLWPIKFGAIYTRSLKRKRRGFGDTFFIDEVSMANSKFKQPLATQTGRYNAFFIGSRRCRRRYCLMVLWEWLYSDLNEPCSHYNSADNYAACPANLSLSKIGFYPVVPA